MFSPLSTLTDALAAALVAYHDEEATILRGFQIALHDGVTLGADGMHRVASDSHPGEYYHCNGACTCRAFHRAPEGRCKHRFAVALVKKAQAQPPIPQAPENARLRKTGYGPWPSLAAEICDPDRRVARELAGHSGPTARHA